MIKFEKIGKCGNSHTCTSCDCENTNSDIYKIKIGGNQSQTVKIYLCYDCLCDFIGEAITKARVDASELPMRIIYEARKLKLL